MTSLPDCVRCGCPYELHTHFHDRDYCGRCPDCQSYKQPPGRFWRWVERHLG